MTAVDRVTGALQGLSITPGEAEDIIALVRSRATKPATPFTFHPSSDGCPLTLEEVVGQAIGAASVCWENMSGTGVFNNTRARAISDALLEQIKSLVTTTVEKVVTGWATEDGGYVIWGSHDPIEASAVMVSYMRVNGIENDDWIPQKASDWHQAEKLWAAPDLKTVEGAWDEQLTSKTERPGWVPFMAYSV